MCVEIKQPHVLRVYAINQTDR